MTDWLPLALLCALVLGAHNGLARAATDGTTNEMGALVVEVSGAIAILLYAIAGSKRLAGDARSIGFAVGSGVLAAVGNILYFVLLRRGAGLAAMGPVVLAGTAVVTALSGYALFGEKLTPLRAAGLALARLI